MMKTDRLFKLTFLIWMATTFAVPTGAIAGIPYRAMASARNAAISQARKNYQQQMKLQAEEQKVVEQQMQKAVEAEAAQERHKREMHIKANRARFEREAKARESAIARRKAENAAKSSKEDNEPTINSKPTEAK